uniref:Uncharacterized protein n=1 Tax=Oryza brachyantha TaxID=4533 RepID=J3LDI0_ORYBR
MKNNGGGGWHRLASGGGTERRRRSTASSCPVESGASAVSKLGVIITGKWELAMKQLRARILKHIEGDELGGNEFAKVLPGSTRRYTDAVAATIWSVWSVGATRDIWRAAARFVGGQEITDRRRVWRRTPTGVTLSGGGGEGRRAVTTNVTVGVEWRH